MEDRTSGAMRQLNFYKNQREEGWWANIFVMEGFKIVAKVISKQKGLLVYIEAQVSDRSLPITHATLETKEEIIEFIEEWGHQFYERKLMGNWLM